MSEIYDAVAEYQRQEAYRLAVEYEAVKDYAGVEKLPE